jgi:hypothetical protein
MLFATICASLLLGAEQCMSAANGDAFTIIRTPNENNTLVYQLRRTPQNGGETVLWSSVPQCPQGQGKNSELLPQPSLLVLSPISAMHEQMGELSLLVFEGESDAFVFRFGVLATQTTPVRIRGIWRAGDSTRGYTGEVRFRNHGELILVSSESSTGNLVRFDALGNITEDSRAEKGVSGALKLVSTGISSKKPPTPDTTSPESNLSPASKKAPEVKSSPPSRSEEPISATPWSLIIVLIAAALGLLWLLLKRRS